MGILPPTQLPNKEDAIFDGTLLGFLQLEHVRWEVQIALLAILLLEHTRWEVALLAILLPLLELLAILLPLLVDLDIYHQVQCARSTPKADEAGKPEGVLILPT